MGKATASDSEAAHSAFLLGKRFFDEADYGSAIHNFVDAYKLDCTKAELLTIIARANELSGNKPEAVHALETYLIRGSNIAPEDKNQIQKRIDNLKAQMAAQSTPAAPPIAPTPPAAVELAPPPPTSALPPPSTPPSPPPAGKRHTVAPWVVTISGGAILVAGGAVWLVGNNKYNTALQNCPNNLCQGSSSSFQSEGNTGHTLMQVGGGLFIGGAVLAVGGLLWHFLEPTGPSTGDATRASVRPELGPGYAGVSGRF
jgi:hypothetical protein